MEILVIVIYIFLNANILEYLKCFTVHKLRKFVSARCYWQRHNSELIYKVHDKCLYVGLRIEDDKIWHVLQGCQVYFLRVFKPPLPARPAGPHIFRKVDNCNRGMNICRQ